MRERVPQSARTRIGGSIAAAMSPLLRIFVLLAAALLIPAPGTAAPFRSHWSAEAIAALPGDLVNLRDKDRNVVDTLPAAVVRQLIDVKQRIAREAGISADLYVVDGDSPDAFAVAINEKIVIAVNIPMLKVFGSDPDSLAAALGHEVAHLVNGHDIARERRDALAGLAGLLNGLAEDRPLARRYPASNPGRVLAALGAAPPTRSFSRDQELEADEASVRFMRSAGFDPNGAARLWRIMPGRNFPFFATHPPSAERTNNIRSIIASLAPGQNPFPSAPAAVKPADGAAAGNADYREDAAVADAPLFEALRAYRAGRFDEARESVLKSAQSGDARGQVAMGSFHLTGQGGFERDYRKAAEYLELADKQGSSMATTLLGTMHEAGSGVSRDPAKAAEYYQRAATAGFAESMARLAFLKMRGQGVPRDLPGALELATKASAENGNLGGFILGLLYYGGVGVTKDLDKARELLERNAARGHAPSEAMLGGMHATGTGVVKNFELAAAYYARAADKNDASAKANLGFLYLGGMGVQGDPVMAQGLFEDAHKRGNPLGALGLGHMYRDGRSVAKDDVLALAYYEVAVRRGLTSATRPRDEVAAMLNPQEVETARKRTEAMLAASQQ